MSTADIIWILILIYGAYKGYRKGFILEVITIVAIVLAILGGFKLMGVGIDLLTPYADSLGKFLPIITFAVIFFLILGAVSVIGYGIKKFVDFTLLGGVDRIAGALLGVLKLSLILSVIIWFFTTVKVEIPEFFTKDSFIYPFVQGIAPKAASTASSVFPSLSNFFEIIKLKLQNLG